VTSDKNLKAPGNSRVTIPHAKPLFFQAFRSRIATASGDTFITKNIVPPSSLLPSVNPLSVDRSQPHLTAAQRLDLSMRSASDRETRKLEFKKPFRRVSEWLAATLEKLSRPFADVRRRSFLRDSIPLTFAETRHQARLRLYVGCTKSVTLWASGVAPRVDRLALRGTPSRR